MFALVPQRRPEKKGGGEQAEHKRWPSSGPKPQNKPETGTKRREIRLHGFPSSFRPADCTPLPDELFLEQVGGRHVCAGGTRSKYIAGESTGRGQGLEPCTTLLERRFGMHEEGEQRC